MIFGIPSLMAAAQLATLPPISGQSVSGQFDGLCQYSPAIRERAVSDMLITCTRAEVDAQGVRFSIRGTSANIRFSGPFEGDRMTVHSVTVHSGIYDRADPREARGLCQIYFANHEVSVISCTAVSGARSWVANFVASRL